MHNDMVYYKICIKVRRVSYDPRIQRFSDTLRIYRDWVWLFTDDKGQWEGRGGKGDAQGARRGGIVAFEGASAGEAYRGWRVDVVEDERQAAFRWTAGIGGAARLRLAPPDIPREPFIFEAKFTRHAA